MGVRNDGMLDVGKGERRMVLYLSLIHFVRLCPRRFFNETNAWLAVASSVTTAFCAEQMGHATCRMLTFRVSVMFHWESCFASRKVLAEDHPDIWLGIADLVSMVQKYSNSECRYR